MIGIFRLSDTLRCYMCVLCIEVLTSSGNVNWCVIVFCLRVNLMKLVKMVHVLTYILTSSVWYSMQKVREFQNYRLSFLYLVLDCKCALFIRNDQIRSIPLRSF